MEAETTSRDVYKIITENIIRSLEKGVVPWRKPWTDKTVPRNFISGNKYRGINAIILSSLGFSSNLFLTYGQVKQLQGSIKRNEKAQLVVYLVRPEDEDSKPYFRYYRVYNISQCDGLEDAKAPDLSKEITLKCDEVYTKMKDKPDLIFQEQSAFYDPMQDVINMPKEDSFETTDGYYATLFHELVHSTGHHKRLERKDLIEMSEFGSDSYSHEELVAEIGAWFLMSHTGIIGFQEKQSAAYINSWIKKFKNDRRFIFTASSQAQKAVDFILGTSPTSEKDE